VDNGNGTLHLLTEIDLLRAKNGQMADEANDQNETIGALCATIEQRATEVSQE
jgi:hypothetical protein